MNNASRKKFLYPLLFGVFFISCTNLANSQVLSTSSASASFFSEAPLENIEASTSVGRAALNIKTGELQFVFPITSFVFEKRLMQEHFNDQYMESEKYPDAKFEGNILDWNGMPKVKTAFIVRGKFTIHGVTQIVTHRAELGPEGNSLHGKSTFSVKLKDHEIKIPRMVIKNIAEEVQVTISAKFEPSK